jgi:hypothetical protein
MSRANIELHGRANDAFNARHVEAFIAFCDPNVEFQGVFTAVGGGVHHGHDGVRRWHRDLQDAWGEEIRIEPEACFDLGEYTLAFNVLRGRGRHSGADVAMPYAQVVRWRVGLIIYFKAYVHREEALPDLGVVEDALVPIAP